MKITKYEFSPNLDFEILGKISYSKCLMERLLALLDLDAECIRIVQGDFQRLIPFLGTKGWHPLLATGSLKVDGDFFVTNSELLLSTTRKLLSGVKPENQGRIAYGSLLMTPCHHGTVEATIRILVVDDKVDGNYNTTAVPYGVGDCYGKMSSTFGQFLIENNLLDRADQVAQFRLGAIDTPLLAKGTMSIDPYVDSVADIVLPLSAIKGGYAVPGIVTTRSWYGVYTVSEPRKMRLGDQYTRIFTFQAKQQAWGESVARKASQLRDASCSVPETLKFLYGYFLDNDDDDNDGDDDQSEFTRWIDIVKFMVDPPPEQVELRDRLIRHPYIVNRCVNSVRKVWSHLTLGCGESVPTFIIIPDDDLPYRVVESVHFPPGMCSVLPYRCPTLNHEEQRPMRAYYRGNGLYGVAYMSHETAASLSGDFDGDRVGFLFWAPNKSKLFEEAENLPDLCTPQKQKRKSERSFTQIAQTVSECKIGFYASGITAAYSHYIGGRRECLKKIIEDFSMKLLTCVDAQKHEPAFNPKSQMMIDQQTIDPYFRKWQLLKKQRETWVNYALPADSSEFGRWIAFVNSFWVPPKYECDSLHSFQLLFGTPTKEQLALASAITRKRMTDGTQETLSLDEFLGSWYQRHDTQKEPQGCHMLFSSGFPVLTVTPPSIPTYLLSRLTPVGTQALKTMPPEGFGTKVKLVCRPNDLVEVHSLTKGLIGTIQHFPVDRISSEPYQVKITPTLLKDGTISDKSCRLSIAS